MPEALRTIAVDLTPLLPGGENGGAKVFTLELLRRLADLAPQTTFILLTQCASHEELAALERHNVRRHMVLNRSARFPRLRRYARSILRRTLGQRGLVKKLKADLLFCPFTAPYYADPSVPTVCTVYDIQHREYPEHFGRGEALERELNLSNAVTKADAVVAISGYTRDRTINLYGVDPEKITTIYLQMPEPKPRLDAASLESFGLTRSRYLIYPANFWTHKNHECLVAACGLARLPSDFRIVCTGAPSDQQIAFKGLCERTGMSNRFVIPGFLSKSEYSELLINSAGLIFPSLYEGFGIPIIEAMSVGVPVACSNLTSLPEVASGAALLFDPRNPEDVARAMICLSQRSDCLEKLVDAGMQRAKMFTKPETMAEQYWQLFEKVRALYKFN